MPLGGRKLRKGRDISPLGTGCLSQARGFPALRDGIILYLQAAHIVSDYLPAVRASAHYRRSGIQPRKSVREHDRCRAYRRRSLVPVRSRFRVGSAAQRSERVPPPRPRRHGHGWARASTRLRKTRKKRIKCEEPLSPRVGRLCDSMPSTHITPISDLFRRDLDGGVFVPGPMAGERSLEPGTGAESPGEASPHSRGKSTPAHCATGWVDSGFLVRGAYHTRHQPSCLVDSTCIHRSLTRGNR